jgi:CubicO group peptidase (beta-lactamase class C family)
VNQPEFDELIRRISFVNCVDGGEAAIDALAITSGPREYAHVFTANGRRPHELRSLSKLVVALCTGIAISSGWYVVESDLLSLDTRIWPTLREKARIINVLNRDHLERITIRDLLTNTTGYSNHDLAMSSWLNTHSVDDLLNVLLNEPIESEPGTEFVYSNASAFLLSAFFHEITGESLYETAQRVLFEPLNILDHAWLSYGGYTAGATGLYLRIEDVHKLGKLMSQRGSWQGRRIVPECFVSTMISKQVDIPNEIRREHRLAPIGYGFFVWVTRDGYYISGARGQHLIVEPDKEIVISVLSNREISNRLMGLIRNLV